MSQVFLKIVNMSISAGYLVLAVLLLRLALKKAPKWVRVLLWGMVAVRLICPFTLESVFSLIPSPEVISPEIMLDRTPEIYTGIPAVNHAINPIIAQSFTPNPLSSANPLQIWIPVAAATWLAGVALMLGYTAISYLVLRRKLRTAVRLDNCIFQSENASSPFVLGVLRPRIYLPFQMAEGDLSYVIAHEQAHIRRKDHLWKPLGFVLLAIHWFNPLMWLGYILLCRDIELACDEKVIREMDSETKADYTQALVSCSVSRRSIAACPLAFGEVGVKARVKSVLHYKKPAFWLIVLSVVACIAVAICFLTDPIDGVSFTKLRNDEVSMPGLLDDVTEMTLIYNGAGVNCNTDDIAEILSILDSIQAGKEPISLNRSEDRSRDFVIKINGSTLLNFNAQFTEFWEDNRVKPSLSHRILNPLTAKGLVQAYERIALSQNATEQLEDPQTQNALQAAISGAILEKNSGDRFPNVPTGAIHTHSYRILDVEGVSGTPMLSADAHSEEVTAYIHYLYARYYYSGGQLESAGETCTPAAITFKVEADGSYTLKEFWEPDPGEGSDEAVQEKFPPAAAQVYLDRFQPAFFSNVLRAECYAQANDYLEQITGNEREYKPYIDKIDYDIDGDGAEETVTLTYGPTSGLFSITLYATSAAKSVEYVDTFVLGPYYDFSFAVEEGTLRLKGVSDQSTPPNTSIDVGLKDGHITLWCEDENVIWGP